MRRLRYQVAASLDGYIAGPKDEFDWIIMDPEIDFAAMFAQFDTLVMGRRTFQAMESYGGFGMPSMRTVVLSRTLRQEDHPGVTIVRDDPAQAVAALKAEPSDKDIFLFGGGEAFRALLDAGLVDAVEVAIIPVLLGGGIPLLPAREHRTALRLTGHRLYAASGIVLLNYDVVSSVSA
jgi:dihydrofolate reductase